MNGTCYGVALVASHTFMKASMNSKKLIITLRAMKSQERIDYASIWLECRKDMENKILILFQILISCLTNLAIFMPITRN